MQHKDLKTIATINLTPASKSMILIGRLDCQSKHSHSIGPNQHLNPLWSAPPIGPFTSGLNVLTYIIGLWAVNHSNLGGDWLPRRNGRYHHGNALTCQSSAKHEQKLIDRPEIKLNETSPPTSAVTSLSVYFDVVSGSNKTIRYPNDKSAN